ncbi:MAG: PQQ-binding-like beta-propeller repeat protein [Planctomycetales bacterium]
MSRVLQLSVWSLLATVFFCAEGARGENWPQWRGPTNNGLSTEKNMPTEWAPDKNIAWKLAMPGQGGSTPCLWGDRLFLTSAEGDDLVVWCVSTEGKKLWDYKLATGNKKARGDEGNLASPSPSTDGKYVWAMVGTGDLACFDFDGKVIWKTNLQDRYGKFIIQFGMSSTPVLDGDRLYLQLIHGDGKPETREALVLCLDKMTGSEIWKQGRPSEAHTENEHSYASPIMYRDEKQAFFLTHGADYIVAHDLADGHELWRSGGLHSPARYDPTLRLVASPACVPGLIIVPSAKKGQLLAIVPGGKGDITDNKEFKVWTYPTTPDVPSPLIVDDLVFLCRENGNLICLERSNGKEVYQKRTHADRYRASPVYCDGKIYLTSRDGTVSVCKASREFELLATNKLAEDISASPVFANGRIYLRSFQSLWAIGTK